MASRFTKDLIISLIWFCVACQQKSSTSNNFSATGNVPAGAPVSGTPTGNPIIQLSWTADKGEQEGFYIEQSSDNVNFAQVQTVADGTYSVNLTGFTPGATYYFRLRAYNQSGTSPYSPVISLTATP